MGFWGSPKHNYVIRDVFDAWNTLQDLNYRVLKYFTGGGDSEIQPFVSE